MAETNVKKENWFVSTIHSMGTGWRTFYEKVFIQDKKVDLSENQDGSQVHVLKKPFPIGKVIGLLAIVGMLVFSFLMMNLSSLNISWVGVGEKISSLFSPREEFIYGYGSCVAGTEVYDSVGNIVSCEGRVTGWAAWWGYMAGEAIPKIWQTVELCFIATVIGCILAIPIYYLSSSNIVKHAYIYQPVRIFNNFLRTIPTLVLAIFAELIFGINSIAGIVAMIFFTLGIMYKLMYEYIETLNMDPFEAIKSSGGRQLQNYLVTLHPEVKPMFFANVIYIFEMNIRGSVILGYVGAGGIGYEISELAQQMRFDRLGAILVPLFIVVFVLQLLSNTISRKLR